MSLINLNKARKSRAKEQAKKRADENAVRFGRTKEQRRADAQAKKQREKILDSHKLDR